MPPTDLRESAVSPPVTLASLIRAKIESGCRVRDIAYAMDVTECQVRNYLDGRVRVINQSRWSRAAKYLGVSLADFSRLMLAGRDARLAALAERRKAVTPDTTSSRVR